MMKVVVDLHLLELEAADDEPRTRAMILHEKKLTTFAPLNIKVMMSPGLFEAVYELWKAVDTQALYRESVFRLLERHCAGYPCEVEVDVSQVELSPSAWPNDTRWGEAWICSLMACYLPPRTDRSEAFLATWPRHELQDRSTVRLAYEDLNESLEVVRDGEEWNTIVEALRGTPFPFVGDLCAYADEGGQGGLPDWVAVLVMSESQANQAVHAAIENYNQHKPEGCPTVHHIHFRELRARAGANHRETALLLLADCIVDELSYANAACYPVCRESEQDRIELYVRALRDALQDWLPNPVLPVYIDTPFDRETGNRQNQELRNRVQTAIHGIGIDCALAEVVLDKSQYRAGIGLADAIAYLMGHRNDRGWEELWQRLVDQGCIQRL